MSANLYQASNDGASDQAQAVLAFLRSKHIEASWNKECSCYDAEPKVSRWENCREQGYVDWFRPNSSLEQINIAFFEHRNSDSICAIKWAQTTLNAPTIDTMDTKGTVYKDKWDTSFSVNYGEVTKMADWIQEQLEEHWSKCSRKL